MDVYKLPILWYNEIGDGDGDRITKKEKEPFGELRLQLSWGVFCYNMHRRKKKLLLE